MRRRLLRAGLLSAAGLGILAASGCNKMPLANGSSTDPGTSQVSTDAAANVEIGAPLYNPAKLPPVAVTPAGGADPVIIRQCSLAIAERLEVKAQVDAELWAVCTPILPGEPQPPADRIWIHPVEKKPYRLLQEGDPIKKDQIVGLLNNKKIDSKYRSLREIMPQADRQKVLGGEFARDGKLLLDIDDKLRSSGVAGGLAEREYINSRLTTTRTLMEQADKLIAALNAQSQYEEAKVILEQHDLRSSINGVIKRIHLVPGSAVKVSQDTILEIENPAKLNVEGQLGVQFVPLLQRHMTVTVEPETQVSHLQRLSAHQQEITALAVGRGPGKEQVYVTGSIDRSAAITDRNGKLIRLPHPAVVKAVACTPAGPSVALTGANDGKVRAFDLTSATPIAREFKKNHSGAVTALACSPDGQYAASADDRSIFLWDVSTGERKYEFPVFHRGPITRLQFTPECKLISVGSDRTQQVWTLGQQGARLEPMQAFEQRSGSVPQLGASPDGRLVLFDQNNKTLKLMTLPEKRTVAALEAPESSAFASFAIFSPDAKLILAGSSTPGRAQLWRVPTPTSPAVSIRQYVCESSAKLPYAITCAAFGDGTLAVAGTKEGDVLVLPGPTEAELNTKLTATVTLIDTAGLDDPTAKQSRIKAELANPDLRLQAGDRVIMVAQPVPSR